MQRNRRVLLIEDDPGVRASIAAWLEDCDYQVSAASDGAEGLRQLDQVDPDAVITDLRMPGCTGFEVLEAIAGSHPDVPLIVVSGTGELQDAVRSFKHGAWDYISKPIQDMAVLEHTLGRCLERADLLKENRRYRERLEQTNRELQTTLRKLREDEAAARQVQEQLLPRGKAQLGSLRCQFSLHSSSVLSGDFVDYFRIDDRHTGFYMTDVSGHGVASAFVTLLVHAFVTERLHTFIDRAEGPIVHPELLLSELNAHLMSQRLGKHLTLFYGVYDAQTEELTVANGGHFPYPMLILGDHPEVVEVEGPAIGLFRDVPFSATRLRLPEGGRLTVLSDGVLEVMDEVPLREKEAMLRQLSAKHPDPAALLAAVGLRPGLELSDDVAALTISREGPLHDTR